MEWTIFVPLLILVFWAGYKCKSSFGKTQPDKRLFEAQLETQLEARLEMAREEIAGQAKIIANIQNEIDELRELSTAKEKPDVLAAIKELEATVGALRTANRTADHILTAGTPAFHHSIVH